MREVLERLLVAAATVGLVAGAAGCEEEGAPPADNEPPVIQRGITLSGGETVRAGESLSIQVGRVFDADNDPLTYDFTAQRGTVKPSGPSADPVAEYTAPDTPGEDAVTVHVSDAKGGVATSSLRFNVVGSVEPSPVRDGLDATIAEPRDGAVVPSEITVKGTTTGVEDGSHIWTVVHRGGLFWPQRQALVVRDKWSAQAFIGQGPRDRGKEFDILAVLADADANSTFEAWLRRGEDTGDFPGLSALPPGAAVLDRVTVTLK